MCEIEQKFISRNETELIKECFRSLKVPKEETVEVSHLGRYGKSGAQLLLCLRKKDETVYVVKLHRAQKINAEHSAMESVRSYFRDLDFMIDPACAHRRGALLYRHQGARLQKRLRSYTELWRIAYDLGKKEDDVTRTFSNLWGCFQHARDNIGSSKLKLKHQYHSYMRWGEAEPILAAVFADDRAKGKFQFLGAEITNPIPFAKGPSLETSRWLKRGPVHGDLHANNVVIDNFENVHLIDFAWANPSMHVLVDYVLMECSLRFLLFPEPKNANYFNPHEQLKADEALLNEDGADALGAWDTGSPLAPHYRRLGTMLRAIRKEAKKFTHANGNQGFLEYLAAQFLVLCGQMTYPDYNRLIVARTLGLIAQRLQASGF